LKEHWRKIVEKIDALALRERALIFVMMSVVLITPVNMFLLDPLRTKQKTLSQQLTDRQSQIAALQTQLQELAASSQIDPDMENRKRVQELKRKLVDLEAPLENAQQSLVSPDKEVLLLEDLLIQNPRLRLVSLKTLPPTTALESKQVEAGKKSGAAMPVTSLVYKHGVQLTIEGGYQDLLQYLVAMEKLPWRVVWGEANFRVDEYPKIVLTLTLYTLSLERVWLSV
jgi:MSHA biogenesis protein MshJ